MQDKYLLSIVVSLWSLFSLNTTLSYSQNTCIIKVGDSVSIEFIELIYFQDLDTNIYPNSGCNIDINNDGANDLYFSATINGFPGGFGGEAKIQPLHQNIYISVNPNPKTDTLNIGDTINGGRTWSNTPCFLNTFYNTMGSYSQDGYWFNKDKYAGIKFISNTDTLFGWIHLKVTTSNGSGYTNEIYLYNYYLFKCKTQNIFPVFGKENINILPNPAKEQLQVVMNYKNFPADISVYDLRGNLILSEKLNEGEINLDVSDIPQGVYILKAVNDNKSYIRKLIIQH